MNGAPLSELTNVAKHETLQDSVGTATSPFIERTDVKSTTQSITNTNVDGRTTNEEKNVGYPGSEKFQWWLMADPGSVGSAFAALFIAYDPHYPLIVSVDEIYTTSAFDTVGVIARNMIKICKEYHEPLSDWRCYYDPAAAWFRKEFNNRFSDSGLIFNPAKKTPGDKEEGLDVVNELIIRKQWLFSQRCGNTIWEIDNYNRDAKGQIPKKHDHQIDNCRYFTKMAGVEIDNSTEREEDVVKKKARSRRLVSPTEDRRRKMQGDMIRRLLKFYGE